MSGRVLSVGGLCLRRGARDVLAGVDLAVDRGEIVMLMGLSGSGKTTVLRAVAGLERPDAGELAIHDDRPASADRRGRRTRVGMVFQFHHLFEHLTAVENVCLAPVHVLHVRTTEAAARARALLEQLGVGHRAGAFPRELSGGEAQRVAIARALAMDPPLLLLDEPTASLDPARRDELGDVLRALAATGRALLVASHDADFVRAFGTRVEILAGGRVVESGDPHHVLGAPAHAATRTLLRRQ